ncbi:MAG: PACE efflux transporter [Tabrizicola sp.]
MTLRSPRERLIQTISYEFGGLCLSVPLVALFGGGSTGEAFWLMLALSVAVMIWSPIHNTVFDWLDLRLSGRLASDRPQRWRLVHAASHEATTIVVTLPILIWLGGFSFWAALLADLGLTLLYAAYAYVFHLVYDRLRPVRPRLSTLRSAIHD